MIANDGGDDTASIQAAIDSLPAYDVATGLGGGVMQLPLGIINVSAPIKLPSGVWLRGHGNGTTIQNWTTAGATRGVIELTSRSGDGLNVAAGVIELGLRGEYCSGDPPDDTRRHRLRTCASQDLRFKGGSRGIDLRMAQVTDSTIERVVMTDPASTALWLGRVDNSSFGNLVRSFRVMGLAPTSYVAELRRCSSSTATRASRAAASRTRSRPSVPLYAAGPRLRHARPVLEYPQQPDAVGYVFDRLREAT